MEAQKQVFRVEGIKFVTTDPDGMKYIKLNDLLNHLRESFSERLAQMYMSLMFVNVARQGQLEEFFQREYQGLKNDYGYANLLFIRAFIEGHLLSDKIVYINDTYRTALTRFITILDNIPTGQKLVTHKEKCLHCTCGYIFPDVKCKVCNGSGEVDQYMYSGEILTDEAIHIIQTELQEFAPIVAEIIEQYMQYYMSDYMYSHSYQIDKYRTGDDKFAYNGGVFTVPFLCNMRGDGKFPEKNITVAYTYDGNEYYLPLIVVDKDLVDEPQSRFTSEKKSTLEVKSQTFVEDGTEVTDSEYKYTKRNGKVVEGFSTANPDWEKYYQGSYGTLTVYFDGSKYGRDEVRTAFANIAKVTKSQISLATISL